MTFHFEGNWRLRTGVEIINCSFPKELKLTFRISIKNKFAFVEIRIFIIEKINFGIDIVGTVDYFEVFTIKLLFINRELDNIH